MKLQYQDALRDSSNNINKRQSTPNYPTHKSNLKQYNFTSNQSDHRNHNQSHIPENMERTQEQQQQQLNHSHHKSKSNKPFLLRKVIYATLLMSLLLVISFYFDILHHYDILSLLLGLLVCIILQFMLLSIYFREQMSQQNTDQVGLIKNKIKFMFGELNLQYVSHKNKIKYYHHSNEIHDKLFDDNNKEVYENVIAHLRIGDDVQYEQIMARIENKWRILEGKLQILSYFLQTIFKNHEGRLNLYNRTNGKIKVEGEDYEEWQDLFSVDQQFNEGISTNQKGNSTTNKPHQNINQSLISNQTQSFYSTKNNQNQFHNISQSDLSPINKSDHHQNNTFHSRGGNSNQFSWKIMTYFIEERIKVINSKTKILNKQILEEIKLYVKEIIEEKESNNKTRNTLMKDYIEADKNTNKILQQIEAVLIKITDLTQKISNNKVKRGEDVQGDLKSQFDLRMLKIQLENLEVKISRGNNLKLKAAECLNVHCQNENTWLENEAITQINNKLLNFINLVLAEEENFNQKLKSEMPFFIRNANLMNNKIDEEQCSKIEKNLQKDYASQQVQDISKYSFNTQLQEFQTLIQHYNGRKQLQHNIKVYFSLILNLYRQLHLNLMQNNKNFQEVFSKLNKVYNLVESQNVSEKRMNKNARYPENLIDKKFIIFFRTINEHESQIVSYFKNEMQIQLECFKSHEETLSKSTSSQIKIIQEDYKKKADQYKKIIKNHKHQDQNVDAFSPELKDSINILLKLKHKLFLHISSYKQSSRTVSSLPNLVQFMAKEQIRCEKYIYDQQKFIAIQCEKINENKNQKENIDQNRYRKFANYNSCLEKYETENFDDEQLNNYSKEQHQPEEGFPNQFELNRKNAFSKQKGTKHSDHQRKEYSRVTDQKLISEKLYKNSKQDKEKSLAMVNRLLEVFFMQWTNSEFFHDFLKKQLQISLNRKKPDLVQNIEIEHIKIVEKKGNPIQNIEPYESELYRCLFDVSLNFVGKIVLQIKTQLKIWNKAPILIKIMINQFKCPLRVCFTPFSLGKSYVSLLKKPILNANFSVEIGKYNLTKIPFFIQFIKLFILLKMRKKMVWPKRMTLSVPLAFKSTLDFAILQRNQFQSEIKKKEKKFY